MKMKGYMGVVGSGKDYNGSKLIEEGYYKISFADGVRETAWSILGWQPETDSAYEYFKTKYISLHPLYYSVGHADVQIRGRDLLINIGDGFRKRFGPDFWIDVWKKKVVTHLKEKPDTNIVVTDVRYPNEVLAVEEFGGDITFCNFHSKKYNANINADSEYISQQLIKKGFSDGDAVSYEDVRNL